MFPDRHPFARIIEIRFDGSSSQPQCGTPCSVQEQSYHASPWALGKPAVAVRAASRAASLEGTMSPRLCRRGDVYGSAGALRGLCSQPVQHEIQSEVEDFASIPFGGRQQSGARQTGTGLFISD